MCLKILTLELYFTKLIFIILYRHCWLVKKCALGAFVLKNYSNFIHSSTINLREHIEPLSIHDVNGSERGQNKISTVHYFVHRNTEIMVQV